MTTARRSVRARARLYIAEADAVFRRALDAGAVSLLNMAQQNWGDRYGILQDPFGHRWSIATPSISHPQQPGTTPVDTSPARNA